MTKCVIVLVLLHFCYSFKLDMNLNREIMTSLDELKNKASFTSFQGVLVPGEYMNKYPSKCVGTFKRELRSILSNLTVHESGRIHLIKLEANLVKLGPDAPNERSCVMKPPLARNISTTLNKYKNILRRLNNNSGLH